MPDVLLIQCGERIHLNLRYLIFDSRFGGKQRFKIPGQRGDVLQGMRSGEGYAETGLAAGDGRVTDGGNEQTFGAQGLGGGEGAAFIAKNDGDDGAG